MRRQILYATSNPGKLEETKKRLNAYDISMISPEDIGVIIDVEEKGETLEENAAMKVNSFVKKTGGRVVVLADDTGLEIEALDGEPGVHPRRWRDGKTRMSDEEIITYCLSRMSNVPKEQRRAQFRTVFAVGTTEDNIRFFDGVIQGVILEKASDIRILGYPFESLFFVPEWNMLFGELKLLPSDRLRQYQTHRGKALAKAMPYITDLISSFARN